MFLFSSFCLLPPVSSFGLLGFRTRAGRAPQQQGLCPACLLAGLADKPSPAFPNRKRAVRTDRIVDAVDRGDELGFCCNRSTEEQQIQRKEEDYLLYLQVYS